MGLGRLIASVGSLIAGTAVTMINYQCMTWLHTNVWPHLPVQRLWESQPFSIEWVAVDRIAQWIARAPLSVMLFLLGIFIAYAGISFAIERGERAPR